MLALLSAYIPAYGKFDTEHPVHHQFNAELLKPGEKQISLMANFKIGISPTLELGTQAFFLSLSNTPNVSIKHHMFDRESVKTTFSSHSFFLSEDAFNIFGSLHGVTSTFYSILPDTNFNVGFYDLFLKLNGEDNLEGEVHNFSVLVGQDVYLSSNWVMTGFIFIPFISTVELVSNFADVEAIFEYYRGMKFEEGYPIFLFASLTRSWEVFNMELGTYYFNPNKIFSPYINMFWRF